MFNNLFRNKKFWLLLIFFTFLTLRLPSLFEPHRYADEDIYLALGMALKNGLVFYKDIHDNKPPFIYLVAAIAGSVFWFRFFLALWQSINIFFVWKLSQKLFSSSQTLIIGLITFIFTILSSIPLFEGNIANGEIFMIMPATIGVYLIWKYQNNWQKIPFFLAGLFFAIAFLFKVPIVFDFAGMLVFLIIFKSNSFKNGFSKITKSEFWFLILGFSLPILLSIAYYYFHGAFAPYVKAALLQNIGYLSSWADKPKTSLPLWQSGLVQRSIILLLLNTVLWLNRKRFSKNLIFVIIWFIFSLYGALLSGRPYPHYLLESIVPFSLILGFVFSKKRMDQLMPVFALIFFRLIFGYYSFWHYQSLAYYQNFIDYFSSKKSQADYFDYFGKVTRNYQIAGFIEKNTQPNEKIFVWGTEPAIYVLAKRLPVGRYTVAYHVVDFNAWQETIANLKTSKPSIIVFFNDNGTPKFPLLEKLLLDQYKPVKIIQEATIYQRL